MFGATGTVSAFLGTIVTPEGGGGIFLDKEVEERAPPLLAVLEFN
jgi:hypothetical protein